MSKKAHNLVLGDDLQGTQETNEKNNCRDDKGYFNTYSHFGIHHEMLTVMVRILQPRVIIVFIRNFTEIQLLFVSGQSSN